MSDGAEIDIKKSNVLPGLNTDLVGVHPGGMDLDKEDDPYQLATRRISPAARAKWNNENRDLTNNLSQFD
jgi:hypothetical protein